MSLYRTESTLSKGPFIPTQRLARLVVRPGIMKRPCLNPHDFRTFRRSGNPESELGPGLPEGCAWEEISGKQARENFLGDLDIRRLCLIVDAGTGKTTALQQTQYLRHLHRGHLALGCAFAELPTNHLKYLNNRRDDPWLLQHYLSVPETLQQSPDAALQFLKKKAASGQLSLIIDAIDQQANIKKAPAQARALIQFLNDYPQVRCVIAGRTYAVTKLFTQLDGEQWDYAQIAAFTEQERTDYVGEDRIQAMTHLESDVVSNPRMLEAVRQMTPKELRGMHTAAELYDHLVERVIEVAYQDQPAAVLRRRKKACRYFALVAWAMLVQNNTDGVSDKQFDDFVLDVWDRHRTDLRGLSDSDQLYREFEHLGALNEIIEFALLDAGALQQIYFRDRTVQDFFAALWVTRYSRNPDDIADLRRRITIQYTGEVETAQSPEHYEFWKFVCGMPVAGQSNDTVNQQANALGVLFEPPVKNAKEKFSQRPCELMWRAWPQLLQCAGVRLPAGYMDDKVDRETWNIAQKVHAAVENKAETPVEFTRNPALRILWNFLSEFPRLCLRDDAVGVIAKSLAFDPVRDEDNHSAEGQYRLCPPWGTEHTYVMGSSDKTFQPPGAKEPWPAEDGRSENEFPDVVTVAPFWLRKFVVTNEELELFLPGHQNERTIRSKAAAQPAVNVTWYDAAVFCWWLGSGYRLPSEREWEAACRARLTREFDPNAPQAPYSFDKEADLSLANYDGKAGGTTVVGTYDPNHWGLYDLHGNVWEWCADRYRKNAHDTNENARSVRVLRGGGWYVTVHYIRSAYRGRDAPGLRSNLTGFRLSRTK